MPKRKVDFFVGPDPEHMSKVMFDEGRVVELNNQAKHAVTNGWSRNRVHLILDYVDVSVFPHPTLVVWFLSFRANHGTRKARVAHDP